MTFYFVASTGVVKTTLKRNEAREFGAAALTMRMFNVGDGEAIVLSRGGEGVLFDGGAARKKLNAPLGAALADYLDQESIKLNAIVATHPHVDHLNALSTLLAGDPPASLAADAVYYHNGEEMGTWLTDTLGARLDVLTAAGQLELRAVTEPTAGRAIPGVQMLHFRDGRWKPRPAYRSIFTRVWFGFASFLFTGDAYWAYEDELEEGPLGRLFDVDVLKITHHGSEHGTGTQFVAAVDPRIAVASTAGDHGHELDQQTRDRLGPGPQVFDTFTAGGDIIIRTDGKQRESGGQDGVIYEVEIVQPGWFTG